MAASDVCIRLFLVVWVADLAAGVQLGDHDLGLRTGDYDYGSAATISKVTGSDADAGNDESETRSHDVDSSSSSTKKKSSRATPSPATPTPLDKVKAAAQVAAASAKAAGKSEVEIQAAADRAANKAALADDADPSEECRAKSCGKLSFEDDLTVQEEVSRVLKEAKGPEEVVKAAKRAACALGACSKEVQRYASQARATAQARLSMKDTLAISSPLKSICKKKAQAAKCSKERLQKKVIDLKKMERKAQADVEEAETKEAEQILSIKESKASHDLELAKDALKKTLEKANPKKKKVDEEKRMLREENENLERQLAAAGSGRMKRRHGACNSTEKQHSISN